MLGEISRAAKAAPSVAPTLHPIAPHMHCEWNWVLDGSAIGKGPNAAVPISKSRTSVVSHYFHTVLTVILEPRADTRPQPLLRDHIAVRHRRRREQHPLRDLLPDSHALR